MLSMALTEPRSGVVHPLERPMPRPGPGKVLVRVRACGVCRTDLHVVDGDLPAHTLPITPGHEIVGVVEVLGRDVRGLEAGQRVGVPWLGSTCGSCAYCLAGQENLCATARFTGYDIDGGYAEFAVADARYVFLLPDAYDDEHAAPLLCAGLIGHRAYRMAGQARRIGIYGFGAAAHIVAQVAVHQGREVYAFTRPGDGKAMAFAEELGVTWAGGSDEPPPAPLDAALIFAPVGALVPEALSQTVAGGIVVCAGIHMSDVPSFPYRLLWGERVVRSVANLTREDARDFLAIAASGFIRTRTQAYALTDANRALSDVRDGRLTGAAVLLPQSSRA
jgi:propanol-preferring alcohol dehydrogenase